MSLYINADFGWFKFLIDVEYGEGLKMEVTRDV
jgi:hypothetical protein